MQSRSKRDRLTLAALLASLSILPACGNNGGGAQAPAGAGAPPPAVVTTLTVTQEAVPMTTELPGRTAAFQVAEVRPQVSGIVKKRAFREGSEVRAGDLLYQIDPASYQAGVQSAQAAVARAEAELHSRRLKAERYAGLVGIEAVSKQDNDEAHAALLAAEAELASARAALTKARIDLEYTRVSAPIAGRIGRSAVTAGALVTANQADALAVIQQLDPIYVDLTQSSVELMRLKREMDSGRLQRSGDNRLPVQLLLEDGSLYRHPGSLAFSEVSVDPATGSVTLRAEFPNPEGDLLPGMYVRARIEEGVTPGAVLLPHAAVSRDPRGRAMVMIVDAQGLAQSRPVVADRVQGDRWVVTEGLGGGDQVIVEGLQRIRPGAPVQPQPPAVSPAPAGKQGA